MEEYRQNLKRVGQFKSAVPEIKSQMKVQSDVVYDVLVGIKDIKK